MVLRGTSKNARVTVVFDHKHIALGLWEKRQKERKKESETGEIKKEMNHQAQISFSLNA